MKKAIANTLVLIAALSVGLAACASGPVLGTPTLLQQGLNLLPAVPIAGNTLQFQFGGDVWIAKLNGQNFSAGSFLIQDTGEGVILTLKQTHMSPSAVPGASAVPGVNWIETPGADIFLEYKAGPPSSMGVLSSSEAAEKLAAAGGAAPSGEGGFTANVASPSDDSSGDLPENLMSLDDAVKRAARGVEGAVPQGTVIAVLNFVSPSKAFSEYVMEELTGELVNGKKVAFVDRRNLEFVTKEMNLQASANIADERMQGIGRTLGAKSVVSGTLTSMGNYYRFRVRVMNVETAAIQAQVSLDLRNDAQVAHLVGTRPASASAPATSATGTTPSGTSNTTPPSSGVVFEGNGHRYEVISKNMSWAAARRDCEKRGGYLATITSEEEQQFIKDLLSKYSKARHYWIGGYVGAKSWQWVTGEPFEYTNRPTGDLNRERLVFERESGLWLAQNNSENTFYTIHYICEWGDVDPAPTAAATASANPSVLKLKLNDNFKFSEGYQGLLNDKRLFNGHKIIPGETYTLKITYTASRDLEDDLYVGLVDTTERANYWRPLSWNDDTDDMTKIPKSRAGEVVSATIVFNTVNSATSAQKEANTIAFQTIGEGKKGTGGSGVKKAVTLNFTEFIFTQEK